MYPILSASAFVLRMILFVFVFGLSAAAHAQSGTIQFVAGDVKIRNAVGVERVAQKGGFVDQGDTVLTGDGTSSAQIKMSDGGILAVRPGSELRIVQYFYQGKEDGTERMVMALVKGGFRTITGLIGRTNRQNYVIGTSTATIGIRGTDHEVIHIPAPGEKPPSIPLIGLNERMPLYAVAESMEDNVPNVPTLVRLAQVGTPTNDADVPFLLTQQFAPPPSVPGGPGTYDKVNIGSVIIITPLGNLVIASNQAGYAPGGLAPFRVPTSLQIFNATPRVIAGSTLGPGGSNVRGNTVTDSNQPASDRGQPQQPTQPQNTQSGGCGSATTNPSTGQQNCNPTLSRDTLAGAAVLNLDHQVVTVGRFTYDITTGTTTDTQTGQTFPQPNVVVNGNLIIGDFGILALANRNSALGSYNDAVASVAAVNQAITSANAANTTTQAVTPVSLGALDTSISNTQTAVGNATTANNTLQGLSLTTTKSTSDTNATSSAGLKSTAATQQSSATSVYTANGTFKDSTADAAKTAMDNAKIALNTADATVQTDKTTVDSQVTSLANAKAAASPALTSASTSLSSAQTDRASANTENNKIGAAQTASTNALATANTQQTTALAAAQAAQGSGGTAPDLNPSPANSPAAGGCASAKACADLAAQYATQAAARQAAQNFTQAQIEFNNSQTAAQRAASFQSAAAAARSAAQQAIEPVAAQLAIAQNAATAAAAKVGTANTSLTSANTSASTVNTQATAGQNAITAAGTALTDSNAKLAAAQAQAAIVAQQAVIAQYNNPANATTNRMGSLITGIKQTAPSNNQLVSGTAQQKANTDYVLDGQKNLVELRQTPAQVSNFPSAAPGADVDVKISGGTAAETYSSLDAVKGSIYYGRWTGSIQSPLVIDVGGTPNDLGVRSLHWIVGYQPSTYYALTLGGVTTYTRQNSTAPTDASGNVGTLNSATLTANFDTQTVNAAVNLTIASRTYGMTANNMAIGQQNTFSASGLTPTCSGTGCLTYAGSLTGAFYRSDASAAGYGYEIHPVVAASSPYTDLITGVTVFTAATPPPPAPIIAEAQAARDAAVASYNAALTSLGLVNTAQGNASSSNTTTQAVTPVSLTALDTSISNDQTAISNATTSNTTLQGLSLTSTKATTDANTTSSTGLKSTAATQQSNATSVYTANGTFKDSTADAAKTAMDNAKIALNTADATIQTDKTTVDTQATSLANAKTTASPALTSANTSLSSAQTDRASANTENNKIGPAQTAASNALATANTQQTTAQGATGSVATPTDPTPLVANSTAATTCASAKACSDLAIQYADAATTALGTGDVPGARNARDNAITTKTRAATFQTTAAGAVTPAQQAATDAAAQKTIAQNAAAAAAAKVGTATTAANNANASTVTVQNALTAGQNAIAAAGTALTDSNTQLATVQAQAAIVAQQAVIAQYNNPANATTNRMGSLITGIKQTAASNNQLVSGTAQQKANTDYVLDGQKNLVELRQTPAQVSNFPSAAPGADVDVKISGGTAAETYSSLDAVKGSIYYGRWTGSIQSPLVIDVGGTPNDLGVRSLHWIVGYQPSTYYALTLGGVTTYTRQNSTAPTDASGNVGTLNSATLTANFDAQTVNAAVNLTIASRTYGMTANNMAIGQQNTFSASGLTPTCSGTGCLTYAGSLTGAFYRSDASAAGYGYEIHPVVAASSPYTDLITGVTVFTTATPPPATPIVADAIAARDAAVASYNAALTSLGLVNTAQGNASSSNTTTQAVTPVSLTALDTSISNDQTAISNATTANTTLQALSITSTKTTTDSNATSSAGLKSTAATQQSNATSVFNANGAFKDATYATPAKTSMDNAKTALDTADGAVQADKTTVDGQVTPLASAKSTATPALASASTSLSSAQTDRASANTENNKIGPAQTAASNALATANTQQTTAQGATGSVATPTDPTPLVANSTAATTCASAKACSDLAIQYADAATTALGTGDVPGARNARDNAITTKTRAATFQTTAAGAVTPAQQAATDAAAQKTIAQNAAAAAAAKVGTATTAANNANASTVTVQNALTAGQTAVAAAGTALTDSNAKLAIVQTNATTVAQQAVIAQYNNPAVATANGFQHTLASAGSKIDGNATTKSNTNYVLDGTKNLVEIRGTAYKAGNFGVAATTDYANADVKFSGGTAADTFKSSDNTIYLGRWQGGTIAVDDLSNGAGVDTTETLGAKSAHWLIAIQPPANYAQNKITGTTTYSVLAKTSPTDMAGNVGTLNSASLIANFTNSTVDAGVNLSVASKTYGMNIAGMPIVGNDFQGTATNTVTCAPSCAGTYSGDLQGAFAKLDASGAGFRYGVWPTVAPGPYTDLIRGVVAFTGTAPPLRPQPAANFATAYVYSSTQLSTEAFEASSTSYTLDGNDNLTAVGDNPNQNSVNSETITGGTAQTKGTATSGAGTVVTFGRWQGPGVSVARSDNGAPTTRPVVGSYEWIQGPPAGPFYLPQALAVTATYSAQGGIVTDQTNATGTIDTVNSTLSVNFTKQQVDANIQASVGGNNWQGTGTGIRLDGSSFFASKGASSPHNNMDVLLNGSNSGTAGSLSGALMGNGVDAAGVGFAFSQGGTNFATGTVAFTSATAQSQSTSYVAGIVAAGKIGTPLNNGSPPSSTTGTTTLASLDAKWANTVNVFADASSRITRDSNNNVVKFDADIPVPLPTGCSSAGTACTGTSQTPGTYTVRANDFPLDTPPSPGNPAPATALTNTGSDAATGITWGRYVGYLSYTDRIGTATGNPAVASGAFNAQTSNWHGIWSAAQTSLPVLPVSGTFTYTSLGGTNPTDSNGNIAAGAATATLTANFTAMTVNTSVSTTVGGNAWAASASNIPIVNAASFQAVKGTGTLNNLTVTMNGSATNTAGKISGVFVGNAVAASPPAGTAGGALLGFSLNQGGAAGVTVQGVNAFKK